MAVAASLSSYVQEWNNEFLSLFPHRFDYIFAPFPQPGTKPNWRTESRHPLSDRIISQGSNLFGVRFGPETRYALLDIDRQSIYHPANDALALAKLLGSLEPLGLVTPLICTSSYSGGLHVYFPFNKAQRSWKLASAMATLVETAGFKIQSGQLELFPNTKHYVTAGSPSLFNAHRLPLQEPGAYLLNEGLEPIWSDQATFLQQWRQCQKRNDLSSTKIRTVLKQQKRTRHFVSEKADKFLNDLNAEIEPGWTGKGQTNRLLGRITMRCFVFHHVIAGGQPLNGQSLIDEVVEIARSLPGYKTWCRHQHEIIKRVTDWVRCIENSHYFPYGTQQGKYKAPVATSINKNSDWNQQQAIAVQEKIKEAKKALQASNNWPNSITERFKSLTKAQISGSSLYRYKTLWHPKFEVEKETNPFKLSEYQQARPKGAANWHNPTSLLQANGRNTASSKVLEHLQSPRMEEKDCNSAQGKGFEENQTRNSRNIIADIKQFLTAQKEKQEISASNASIRPTEEQQEKVQSRLNDYLERLQGYLCSKDELLISEALDVLSLRPDYLAQSDMQQALEAASQATEETFPSGRPSILIRLLSRFAKLQWKPEQLRAALRQLWNRSALRELTTQELQAWERSLSAPP